MPKQTYLIPSAAVDKLCRAAGVGRSALAEKMGVSDKTLQNIQTEPSGKAKVTQRTRVAFESLASKWKVDLSDPPPRLNPFDFFLTGGFDRVKGFVEAALKPNAAESPDALADVLLHSIQPAYYLKKVDVLREYVSLVRSKPDRIGAGLLARSLQIVRCACEFYTITANNPDPHQLRTVLRRLESGPAGGVEHGPNHSGGAAQAFLPVIQLDFLGLCHFEIYTYNAKNNRRLDSSARADLNAAIDSFERALGLLSRVTDEFFGDVVALWRGYLYRNLGRAYGRRAPLAGSDAAADRKLAKENLERAKADRVNVCDRLRLLNCDERIAEHKSAGVEIVDMDIALLDGNGDRLALLADDILDSNKFGLITGLHAHLYSFLCSAALELGRLDVVQNVILKQLAEVAPGLVGDEMAHRIVNELRDGKSLFRAIEVGSGSGASNGRRLDAPAGHDRMPNSN
jgi:hypothetical protein